MVGIILYGPFELAPYSKKYMRILRDAGEQFDLIGWRREETVQYEGDNVFIYDGKSGKRYSSVLSKLAPARGYRKFVKKVLKQKKYDKLVILTTQTAILLADVLLTRYRGRYIFDYRDKSYEYIKPYSMLVNTLIKGSAETVISSEWFSEALTDKKDYILDHNFSADTLKYWKKECVKKRSGKIIAGYIGALREYEYHKRLIDSFKDDKRFEFHTYGCGDDSARLAEYAKDFDNIFVHGAYKESEKCGIIEQLDIMCYNYPYSYVNDGAVANKYYDSLIMKKPMFVNPRTVLGRFIEKEGLGVGVSEDGIGASERIYNWYRDFDKDKFAAACDACMDKYIKENEMFYKRIGKFFG